jgi:hypothetical protein
LRQQADNNYYKLPAKDVFFSAIPLTSLYCDRNR